MQIKFVANLIIGFIICNSASVFAETKFIIGVEDNRYFPHYSYEDGEYIGIGRQLLDAFFTAKGYQYEFRALPVARLFQSFVDNECIE